MNTNKKYLAMGLLFAALSVSVAGCAGSSSADDEANDTTTTARTGSALSPGTGSPAPITPSGSTGSTPVVTGPTGSTGSTVGSDGCPLYPARSFYNYSLRASGTATASTTYNDVVADQKLRVSIVPGPAWASGAAIKNYTKMALTVELLRNGSLIATKQLPITTHTLAGVTYADGIATGTPSDPSLLDFSAYLYGTAQYSIRVRDIKTNYKCATFCTQSYYRCAYQYNAGDWSRSTCGGYLWNSTTGTWEVASWNYDYNVGMASGTNVLAGWHCCPGTVLNDCSRLQCGVGSLSGLTDAGWSMEVRVETDSTSCVPRS